jgi:hypothetical protein
MPKVDESFEEASGISENKSNFIKLNEIAYMELILLIDVMTSSGKVAFSMFKG